jgi:hypothetical protein
MKSNNFYTNKMTEEINSRLKSEEWNSKIAAAVIDKKNNTKKKIFYTVSGSFLAAAAAVAIILSGVLNNKNDSMIYDEFITAQIKGTYDAAIPVTTKKTAKKTNGNKKTSAAIQINNNEDIIFTEDIDSLISETLALR